jgi:hypothetical protein
VTDKPVERVTRLGRLNREIRELEAGVGRDIYEIGRRLATIRDDHLYREAGYTTFTSWVHAEVRLSYATAWRFMHIAEQFNASIARRYGIGKLMAAMRYLEATGAQEQPGDLMAAEIRLRDERGRFFNLSLHDATTQQISQAIALLADVKRGARRIPRSVKQSVARLNDVLPTAPPGTRSGPRIRMLRGDDGRLAYSFQAIPHDGLEAFVTALRVHLGDSS